MRSAALRPLVLRADAAHAVGTGHVLRALALAQRWHAAGGEVTLATRALPPALARRMSGEGVGVAWLPADADGARDADATAALARALGAVWVVADGYGFDGAWQARVAAGGARLLTVDDDAQIGRYAADMLLDQNVDASPARYAAAPARTRLLLGSRYVLLRHEFTRDGRRSAPVAQTARRLLVTFGGSDPLALTPRVLRLLAAGPLSTLDVRVVVGPAAAPEPVEEAAAALRAVGHTVRLVCPGAEMPALMRWADLAITAAGSTCWELAYLGVPAVTVVVAPNQAQIATRLAARGATLHAGTADEVEERVPAALDSVLGAPAARARMARAGRALVDGRGAARVARALCGRAA